MIITKTPVRISIAGGGTDLPPFYKKFGSEFVSAAIDKYVYVVVHERKYYKDFLLKYSRTEKVEKVDNIKNEIIRECLKYLNITQPLEIVPISDIGGETGLGSSGAFTVGLLNALHTYKGNIVSQKQLAEEACYIAMDVLKQPSGKQDEYIAAFGGLTTFKINKKGMVMVLKNEFDREFIDKLQKHLAMFFTGIHRKSKDILAKSNVKNYSGIQELGLKIIEALKNKDGKRFGELMHEHWLLKRQRSLTTNDKIDKWYNLAKKFGAVGGKIMGAGGGGFFLFFSNIMPILKYRLKNAGLKYIPFKIDWEGTRVIVNL
jgi:D-glycero-alpha-D-manno-heptose-7-phosphate kinase